MQDAALELQPVDRAEEFFQGLHREQVVPNKMKIQAPAILARIKFPPLLSMGFLAVLTGSSAGNWDAAAIDVHEWGVNTFDWDSGNPLVQDFPDYLYTDKRPGESFPSPKPRVRDLPPDSGVRTKPILYFYPSKRLGRGPSEAEVGIEMRFAYGYANAWWPQVNRYRDAEMSAKAGAPNWEGWKKKALEARKASFLKNNIDEKGAERWAAEFAEYEKLAQDDQIQRLTRHRLWSDLPDFPEDDRMQLVWEKLTLHHEVPEGQSLPGKDLKKDHWAKIAREVDAAFVNNGKEAERYVFYEGKTTEETAIALLPANGGARHTDYSFPKGEQKKEVSLVNVGKHTIYDVIAVYRDREKGILWSGYLPVMSPRTVALRIPDFQMPGKEDELKLSEVEFRRRTTDRLIENLTSGTSVVSNNVMGRDPADPQGPTERHQLFKKEAVGLEKIWHDDFFKADGFTVIYRESPEYLDEAMPLNIFSSMYWHIRLSRCGLVLNRNLPLKEVYKTDKALWDFQIGIWNPHLKKDTEAITQQLRKNRLLTLGQARFHLPGGSELETSQIKEIRKLLE